MAANELPEKQPRLAHLDGDGSLVSSFIAQIDPGQAGQPAEAGGQRGESSPLLFKGGGQERFGTIDVGTPQCEGNGETGRHQCGGKEPPLALPQGNSQLSQVDFIACRSKIPRQGHDVRFLCFHDDVMSPMEYDWTRPARYLMADQATPN